MNVIISCRKRRRFNSDNGLIIIVACIGVMTSSNSYAKEFDAIASWHKPSSVRLEVTFPGDGYHASWKFHRCDCGDLLVISELSAPGEVQTGDMLLVGGQVLLSKGFPAQDSEVGMSLDPPALMMQLAFSLLERSAPAGPGSITENLEIDTEETMLPIRLDSGQAVGTFMAPWSVRGGIQPVSETRRRFDLQFEFSTGVPGETQRGEMQLSGFVEYAESDFPVPDDTDITNWTVHWPYANPPPAEAVPKARTLAELREWLRTR
jgi:hypothetical protein